MNIKALSIILAAALAIPPVSPTLAGKSPQQPASSKEIAKRIAMLSPRMLPNIDPGSNPDLIPVRRGGSLVAGIIIGAVVVSAISRSKRKKRYKRYRRSKKYRRYW